MPNKKLTDNEIVKGMEWCKSNTLGKCKKCTLEYTEFCCEDMPKAIFDLINRLQAENERLREEKAKIENKIEEIYPLVMELPKVMQTTKAEAYKECIKKVEKIICDNTYPSFDKDGKAVSIWKSITGYDAINNLLKETEGK